MGRGGGHRLRCCERVACRAFGSCRNLLSGRCRYCSGSEPIPDACAPRLRLQECMQPFGSWNVKVRGCDNTTA